MKNTHIFRRWAGVFFLLILILLPLYTDDQYFHILEAKCNCFLVLCVVMLPVGILLRMFSRWSETVENRSIGGNGPITGRISPMDPGVFAFAAIALLSCLLSDNIRDAFLGTQGWGVGACHWILLAWSYYLISISFQENPIRWIPVILLNAFLGILAACHGAGIDALAMHEGILKKQYFDYLATLGNVNSVSGYVCLLMPVAACFFLEAERKIPEALCLLFWGSLCILMILCDSDSVFSGLGVCLFLAVPYIFQTIRRIGKTGILISIFGGILFLLRVLPCYAAGFARVKSGICFVLFQPAVGAVLLVLGLLVYGLSVRRSDLFSATRRRKMVIGCEVVLALVALAFFVKSILSFNDAWGTNRGQIWRVSMEVFRDFSFKQKLFGVGPDMLRESYNALSADFGMRVLVSHSEPIQYLLTTGVIGLLAWCSIWAGVFWDYAGRCRRLKATAGSRDPQAIGTESPQAAGTEYIFSITAYLGQSLVNSGMTTNLAILFLLMALYRASGSTGEL